MNSDFVNELYKDLVYTLAHPGYRQEDLYLLLNKKIQALEDAQVKKLTQKIKDWEIEVPDDTTLYTLGLRQAIDLIHGNEPL